MLYVFFKNPVKLVAPTATLFWRWREYALMYDSMNSAFLTEKVKNTISREITRGQRSLFFYTMLNYPNFLIK
jgi:hypothetical protein